MFEHPRLITNSSFSSWKKQLQKKQEESEFTKDTIKILVQNILPAHVGEIL